MWQQKHCCSLLLGCLQRLPLAIRVLLQCCRSALLGKLGKNLKKGQQYKLALKNIFTSAPPPPQVYWFEILKILILQKYISGDSNLDSQILETNLATMTYKTLSKTQIQK